MLRSFLFNTVINDIVILELSSCYLSSSCVICYLLLFYFVYFGTIEYFYVLLNLSCLTDYNSLLFWYFLYEYIKLNRNFVDIASAKGCFSLWSFCFNCSFCTDIYLVHYLISLHLCSNITLAEKPFLTYP
jgi:hypothetical protein